MIKGEPTKSFQNQIELTLKLMKVQALQSLFLQLKANPKLDPNNTEFLSPYQRYLKYKKVGICV